MDLHLGPLLDGPGHADSSRPWGQTVGEVQHRSCDQDLYRSGAGGHRVHTTHCELLTGWAGVCHRIYNRCGEGV